MLSVSIRRRRIIRVASCAIAVAIQNFFVFREWQELLGQVKHFAEPVENDRFQLSTRWTCGPGEAHDSQTRRQQLAEDRRVGISRRKVGMEPWMLPVSELEFKI